MTLFEYLAIAFSLVFTLAAIRIAGGLPHAIIAQRRYWLHLLLVINLLYYVIALFWNFWSFRVVEWNQYYFIMTLSIPGLIYTSVAIAIPDNPSRVRSWRDHYFEVSRRVYSTLRIGMVMAIVVNMTVLGQSWTHPSRFFQAAFLCLYGVLVATNKPKVHEIILPIVAGINAIGLVTFGYRPGWLAT